MPRPPSKHGLEKKFKPWRKGKSTAAKNDKPKAKASCLKSQLRSQARLLAKVAEGGDPEKLKELKERVENIKKEISSKAESERQRKHAQKSHGVRFLERQRLFRMEKSTRKLLVDAKGGKEKARCEGELTRIALDQAYVAHFPHDQKYVPLFRQGTRAIDDTRTFARRVITRSRILKNLKEEDMVDWISKDQYALLPKGEWTVEMEKETFGVQETTKDNSNKAVVSDNRFALGAQQEQLLEAAKRMESTIAVEERDNKDSDVEDSESDGDSDDSSENADPLNKDETSTKASGKEKDAAMDGSNSDSASDSSSDSSDDSSDEEDEEKEKPVDSKRPREDEPKAQAEEDDFDDFLMPANDEIDAVQVFKQAKQDRANKDFISGDKSKGWKTQRQKPGDFKKPKIRK
jgi:hypothetical protein